MRNDETCLLDMLIAARRVKRFTTGMTRADFAQSELQVLGEAARLVSAGAKSATPQIPWTDISGMCNRIIHEYFRVSLDVVWNVVTSEITPLIAVLEGLVPPEDPEPNAFP